MRTSLALLLYLLCSCAPAPTVAQDAPRPGRNPFGKWDIQPILAGQAWATYTTGQREFDADQGRYVDVDDRLNFMFRRLRFGSTARVGERLFFKFLGAADFVGSDQRAATVGGVNNGAFPNLQVWDIYAQYRLSPRSEALYVIGGFLRPPLGRENMSGALGVSSFEKSFSQWYIRQQATGTGPGGTGGVYLGGLASPREGVQLDYRGGVFNPQQNGISAGRRASSLFVGRLNLTVGDPERTTWAYGLATANSFGRRRGVSLAVNASHEGATGVSGGSTGLGVDWLVSLAHWHLEGEAYQFRRRPTDGALADYTSTAFMVRTGFNLAVPGPEGAPARYLEPTAMVYGFRGATTLADYPSVLATGFFGGEETIVDVGLNYHLVPGRLRLGLHYVTFSGDRGELPPDGRLSQAHFQPGIGGIERGNYLGFEVIMSR